MIAVVEVIVSLQAQIAIFGKEIFYVKVTNKVGCVVSAVALSKTAVENEAIIEELTRQI